jgi:glycosyltransferase involved in cell wall biosynthesis
MVEALAPHFDFYILTLNRDSGSHEVYTSVRTGAWNRVGAAHVYYTPDFRFSVLRGAIDEVRPDALYLNGFFSRSSLRGLVLRRVGGLPSELPIVLATRGDLAPGALGLKATKKRVFTILARAVGLYGGLHWHASSEREKSEMLRQLGSFGVRAEHVQVASDLGVVCPAVYRQRSPKLAGEASFVTVSRVARMKNLPFTLDRLAELRGRVTLDVFGPLEDRELWSECERMIEAMPENVSVCYHGELDPGCVFSELAGRQFFVLPTLGENYGHVIIEGAAAGCPVIISDRTQWLGLAEKGIGWDIALHDPLAWRSALQACVDMGEPEYRAISVRAAEFGQSIMKSTENLRANLELFNHAVSGRSSVPERVLRRVET